MFKKGVGKKTRVILSFKKKERQANKLLIFSLFFSSFIQTYFIYLMETADQAMHSLFAGTATELHLLTGEFLSFIF